MYACGSVCVSVDWWLKKRFYLQHIWTASDCLKDLCLFWPEDH